VRSFFVVTVLLASIDVFARTCEVETKAQITSRNDQPFFAEIITKKSVQDVADSFVYGSFLGDSGSAVSKSGNYQVIEDAFLKSSLGPRIGFGWFTNFYGTASGVVYYSFRHPYGQGATLAAPIPGQRQLGDVDLQVSEKEMSLNGLNLHYNSDQATVYNGPLSIQVRCY